MKKRLLALLCALVMLTAAIPAASALAGEGSRAADALYTLGLIRGTASGYALSASATRAAAVTELVRLSGSESAAAGNSWISGFRDVPAWCTDAVNYASRQNWVTGVTVLDFCPDRAVTANAWCTMLLRMLGYSDKAGDFSPDAAALFAQHIGLTSVAYSGPLSRGDLFAIAYGALTFPYKGTQETVAERLISRGVVSTAAASALGLLDTTLTARQISDRCTAAVFRLDLFEKQIAVDANVPTSNGSGFFLSPDGVALTNYHCIEDAIYATVTLSTGESYPVEKVLWYDAGMDLAVIRISRTSLNLRTVSSFACLELAGTQDIRTGDTVYTISNPLGLGLAVSAGVISSTSQKVERYSQPCIMDTADISRGSSGGALLNAYGQVIGVTSGAYTYGNSMYLAVPVDPVMKLDLASAQGQTLAEVAAAQAKLDAASAAAQSAG
jgi:S1-C subfamily serine protease